MVKPEDLQSSRPIPNGVTCKRFLRSSIARSIALVFVFTLIGCSDTKGEQQSRFNLADGPYAADYESLKSHSVPEWFKDAKFGIFIHWGPYSVPAFADAEAAIGLTYSEWYWFLQVYIENGPQWNYHLENYGQDTVYDDFIAQWKAEAFNAGELAALIADSGAKYGVLVTKHHDGVALFDSTTTRRDTVDLGPGRDLVREYTDAMNAAGLHVGLYYSLYEWFHPTYHGRDGHLTVSGFEFPIRGPVNPYTDEPISYAGFISDSVQDYHTDHQIPQMLELIDHYDPDLLWYDGGWDLPASAWDTSSVTAHFYNQAENRQSPKPVVVNDRVGANDGGWQGDYYSAEYEQIDGVQESYWEATRGIGTSFGYNAQETEEHYLTANEIIDTLVDVVSKNGNLLLNIGPKADGSVIDMMTERLRETGDWLAINGEAIYGSRPWQRAGDDAVRYTTNGTTFYAILLEWPGNTVDLSADVPLNAGSTIAMLGAAQPVTFAETADGFRIQFPDGITAAGELEHAWTLKITGSD